MSETGPYPRIDLWEIPADALAATLRGVADAGQRGLEAGALWLGHRDLQSTVTDVVLPRGRGVHELPQRWHVSSEVYGVVSRWALPRSVVLLAMVHIHHGDSVEMSWSDRYRVVQVPGMLSIIIGNAGTEADNDDWGWYVYDDGEYRSLGRDERSTRIKVAAHGSVTVWEADDSAVVEVLRTDG